MTEDELRSILYTALAEPVGVVLRTSNTERARQRLYKARRDTADPDLEVLQIRLSPVEDGDLIICKGAPKAKAAAKAAPLVKQLPKLETLL